MRNLLLAVVSLCAVKASAFCGFYVAGGGAELFNNATQVVLMREGTKTVLSMQNTYQGPPADFAMVVPVPVVLKKENVKTLPREIFARVDALGAPRLVEYWETDPCGPTEMPYGFNLKGMGQIQTLGAGGPHDSATVKIEAQFSVGEYDIVVLSAKDALGLEQWLHENKYTIPQGAEPLFRPYVQQGMKFFVAKVDAKKVTFDKSGQAQLSPLRFHYDSEKFELPIRLGLINAKDKQDLIVSILGRNQRYEVANYPNVTIPTNIDLVPSAQSEFPYFYVSLFDRTLAKHPKAVVTEYAWASNTCDPCPVPPLSEEDVLTLGGDVTKGSNDLVLTRLHARYDKTSLGEDLVFKAATGISGGREWMTKGKGVETGAKPDRVNNFQARYAIRHPWQGKVECKAPVYGRWGAKSKNEVAQGTAFVKRDPTRVDALAESPIPEVGVKGLKPLAGIPLPVKK